MGGCQNRGPCLGTLNIRCRSIIGTQKGTIILTTTQILRMTMMASRLPVVFYNRNSRADIGSKLTLGLSHLLVMFANPAN